jgi:hypothetical protein
MSNFVANEGNTLLQAQAYAIQDFLMDRPEVKGFEAPGEIYKNKPFQKIERQTMESAYSTFTTFYNPANALYNKSQGFV